MVLLFFLQTKNNKTQMSWGHRSPSCPSMCTTAHFLFVGWRRDECEGFEGMLEKDECVIKRITCLPFCAFNLGSQRLNHLLPSMSNTHKVCATATLERTLPPRRRLSGTFFIRPKVFPKTDCCQSSYLDSPTTGIFPPAPSDSELLFKHV